MTRASQLCKRWAGCAAHTPLVYLIVTEGQSGRVPRPIPHRLVGMSGADLTGQYLPVDGDGREHKFFRRRPSTETLDWVAASMGPGSRVVGHSRLTGGINSAVHRLTVERHDTRTFVV